jgi:hypothetical protein
MPVQTNFVTPGGVASARNEAKAAKVRAVLAQQEADRLQAQAHRFQWHADFLERWLENQGSEGDGDGGDVEKTVVSTCDSVVEGAKRIKSDSEQTESGKEVNVSQDVMMVGTNSEVLVWAGHLGMTPVDSKRCGPGGEKAESAVDVADSREVVVSEDVGSLKPPTKVVEGERMSIISELKLEIPAGLDDINHTLNL